MNVMRMWEENFCKIHNEKLETVKKFRAEIVYFLRKIPSRNHWPKFPQKIRLIVFIIEYQIVGWTFK